MRNRLCVHDTQRNQAQLRTAFWFAPSFARPLAATYIEVHAPREKPNADTLILATLLCLKR